MGFVQLIGKNMCDSSARYPYLDFSTSKTRRGCDLEKEIVG
jgi:hypothetical protein